MKNKGFTLIEMIGIITVLAVILLVVFPNISNGLKTMKEAKEKNFTDNLKISAEAYIGIYQDNYPELKTPNGSIQIKIKDLYDSNLLKGRYENVDLNSTITITRDQNNELKYYYGGNQIGE